MNAVFVKPPLKLKQYTTLLGEIGEWCNLQWHYSTHPTSVMSLDRARPHYIRGGNGSVDAGGDLCSAAKGSAIDLEVAGSGPLAAVFPLPPRSLPCVLL